MMFATADVARYFGTEEFQKNYPDHYIDVGIAEQNLVGVAAGMQKEGHITMLYVLPVFQRRGCGRCLLEEMKAYAANQYQLQRVTLSAMPAWTADYFTKRRFHPMEVTQPCSFVPMQAKTVARAIYEKKEIPSGVILGTSIGGLAVCAAVAVGFMVLWMHGIV
jgi:N-acetylglutamate synthase-like GNAT family acetyltransferase